MYLGETLAGGETRIQLCGALVVRVDGERLDGGLRGQQGLLFTYLAINRFRWVTRDELAAALWPEQPPPAVDTALSALVSKLRRALGDGFVEGRSRLRLRLPENAWVDVESAAEAIHRASSAVAQGRWTDAWGPAHVVVHTANRGFLAGHDAPWIEEQRRELEELLLRGLECLAEIGLGLGASELPTADRAARRLVKQAPFRESARVLRMRVLIAQGNHAEAMRVYDDLRNLLRDELGVVPGAEVQSVYDRLLSR